MKIRGGVWARAGSAGPAPRPPGGARGPPPAHPGTPLQPRHTGQNFRQLLQQRKLQQAAYLLGHTPLPVESILENIGYENSSYFYRRFRARYGCSPAEYRASRSV